ncbi:MAG: MlaD family protein [Rubricoccaceae bacterium]|nr:MlaD family protein [Rubricoccaceae bacterium]
MSNELKVGLVVLAALLIFIFGLRFLQGLSLFGGSYEVVVVFDNSQGLSPGNPVRLSGVDIGAVREVALSDGGREVLVALSIEDGVEIPRGSTFGVGGFAALGDVYVSIEPPEGPTAGRPLVDRDTLRAEPSADLVSLLTDQAGPLAQRADTLLISAIETFRGVESLLAESSDDLDATIANVRFLTTATTRLLLDERERIGDIAATLERAARSAERSALAAEGLVDEYGAAFGGSAPAVRDSLTATVATLNARLRQLESSLDGLDRLTVGLDTTLALATSPESSIGLLLRDPSLYYNANAAAASLEQLLTDFQNDPARYLDELQLNDLF